MSARVSVRVACLSLPACIGEGGSVSVGLGVQACVRACEGLRGRASV